MASNEEIIVYKGADIQKRIPGLLEMVMLDDVAVELRKMNRHFDKEKFIGVPFCTTLNATDVEQKLDLAKSNTLLITCDLFNIGANEASILLNDKGDWVRSLPGIPYRIDFKGGDDKLSLIRYLCPVTGNTTTIVMVGKY